MSNDKIYSVSRKNDRKVLEYEDIESEIEKAKIVYLQSNPDIISIHDSISMMERIMDENSGSRNQISYAHILKKSLDNKESDALNAITSSEIDSIFYDAIIELGDVDKDSCRLSTHTERTIGMILNSKNVTDEQLRKGRNVLFLGTRHIAYGYADNMWKNRSTLYKNFELDDFVQAGMEGLWVSICRYNGMNRISSYAVWWIRHYIQRISPNDIPRNIIEKKSFNDEKLLSLATPSQLPEFDSDNDFAQYVEQSSYTYSTSTISSKSVEDQIEEDDMDQRISACIHDMPKIEQAIAKNIANDGTMKYILDKFNITSRQYRLTYARALSDLRKAVGEE